MYCIDFLRKNIRFLIIDVFRFLRLVNHLFPSINSIRFYYYFEVFMQLSSRFFRLSYNIPCSEISKNSFTSYDKIVHFSIDFGKLYFFVQDCGKDSFCTKNQLLLQPHYKYENISIHTTFEMIHFNTLINQFP